MHKNTQYRRQFPFSIVFKIQGLSTLIPAVPIPDPQNDIPVAKARRLLK